VRVLEDTERRYRDGGVLRVRVLSVPESEKFPDGIKYRLHYGTDASETIIRYDNSHGQHERHTAEGLNEGYEFPGYDAVQRRVTVESIGDLQHRTGEAFEQALSDDWPEGDAPRRLSFETTDQLARVFTPRAIDLLQVIAQDEPASIREAARLVDRDIKQVSENLERLEEYGIVEFEQEGRAMRPVVEYDEIDIQLPLRQRAETDFAPA